MLQSASWGGVSAMGGGSAPGGRCLPGLGGSAWSRGVWSRGEGGLVLGGWVWSGGSAWSGGGLVWGGSAWSGGVYPSMHWGRHPLPPPVDRILDTRLWKYYLGPTSLWPVNIYDTSVGNLNTAQTQKQKQPVSGPSKWVRKKADAGFLCSPHPQRQQVSS